MAAAQQTVTRLLGLKADANIATKTKVAATLVVEGEGRVAGFQATTDIIAMLASCSSVEILKVTPSAICKLLSQCVQMARFPIERGETKIEIGERNM
jgi:hypothetical protein